MQNNEEEKNREMVFKRNTQLESLLSSINGSLACAEENLLEAPSIIGPDYPLIFIMGPLRSGTTLFTQWLASSGVIAYPTNLLSRFYGAPLIGAQIQLMLTDVRYNFRNEILDFNNVISFYSENGKTTGALAPNEFWYFWRRFLPFKELDWLSDEELFNVVDKDKLVNELSSLTRVFGKPFALKSMILNYNIPFLNTIFNKALFVQIKRDPITNVSSILDARKRQLGSEREWYSFRIPEYEKLKDLDPITQSAGQLYYINNAVTKGMKKVNESRKIVIEYEEFCQNPCRVFEELVVKLGIQEMGHCYSGVKKFTISRSENVPKRKLIEKAISSFPIIK